MSGQLQCVCVCRIIVDLDNERILMKFSRKGSCNWQQLDFENNLDTGLLRTVQIQYCSKFFRVKMVLHCTRFFGIKM